MSSWDARNRRRAVARGALGLAVGVGLLLPAAAQAGTITFTLDSVNELQCGDGGSLGSCPNDYYARVFIDGRDQGRLPKDEFVASESFSPRWTFSATVPDDLPRVGIRLLLMDEDAFGVDDEIDVAPGPGRALEITVQQSTGFILPSDGSGLGYSSGSGSDSALITYAVGSSLAASGAGAAPPTGQPPVSPPPGPGPVGGQATSPAGGGTASVASVLCPRGTLYDAARAVCVIPRGLSRVGEIEVGPPSSVPAGGIVVALDVARQLWPASPCVRGVGSPYVVVGTSSDDRLAGTPQRDRVLGLGGDDRLAGAAGADCLDAGSGDDATAGGAGDDHVYGGPGADRVSGGSGDDYLSGGAGRDTISAGAGSDQAFGGPGNDAINLSTAGSRASASCGDGRDAVRVKSSGRRGLRGCERVTAPGAR